MIDLEGMGGGGKIELEVCFYSRSKMANAKSVFCPATCFNVTIERVTIVKSFWLLVITVSSSHIGTCGINK